MADRCFTYAAGTVDGNCVQSAQASSSPCNTVNYGTNSIDQEEVIGKEKHSLRAELPEIFHQTPPQERAECGEDMGVPTGLRLRQRNPRFRLVGHEARHASAPIERTHTHAGYSDGKHVQTEAINWMLRSKYLERFLGPIGGVYSCLDLSIYESWGHEEYNNIRELDTAATSQFSL